MDAKLAGALEKLARQFGAEARVAADPVEVPRRFSDPADAEVVGLVAASLAYGRVDLFKPVIERIVAAMGRHPAGFARRLARKPAVEPFEGIVYRFNRPRDFAALVAAIGCVLDEHGSLGRRFARLYRDRGSVRGALADLGSELREAPPARSVLGRRGGRGLLHLLPDAGRGGACKRWNLYLRWMVRGPDGVDLGTWRGLGVQASALVIPLDVHVGRIARMLGLTRRTGASWRTAEEITAALREIDPEDPVRFDFVLCHLLMSGRCAQGKDAHQCRRCVLAGSCSARVR